MLTFVWNSDIAAMLCRAWWMLRRRWRRCWCLLATRFRLVVAWMLRSTAETSFLLAARAGLRLSPALPFNSFFSSTRQKFSKRVHPAQFRTRASQLTRHSTRKVAQLSNMMPCAARGRRLPSLMLVAGCLGFTELAHVLVQTPQRSRTHAAIRPRLAIASKPQGSRTLVLTRPRHAVVRAAAAGEMGFQLQAAPLLSTALVFLSWGWLQWKSSAYNSIGDELDAELETLQKLTVETLTSGDAAAVERREAAQRAPSTRRGHGWRRPGRSAAREDSSRGYDSHSAARHGPSRKARHRSSVAKKRGRGRVPRRDALGPCPRRRRPADGCRCFYVHGGPDGASVARARCAASVNF